MGFFNNNFGDKNSGANRFGWTPLAIRQEWADTVTKSQTEPVVVFKHSARCAISRMAQNTFEKEWDVSQNTALYMLSVLDARDVSNQIATDLGVRHESPQLLLVHNGKAVAYWSHQHIDAAALQRRLEMLEDME